MKAIIKKILGLLVIPIILYLLAPSFANGSLNSKTIQHNIANQESTLFEETNTPSDLIYRNLTSTFFSLECKLRTTSNLDAPTLNLQAKNECPENFGNHFWKTNVIASQYIQPSRYYIYTLCRIRV